ncbi:DUF4279 domain-containing protein [Mesorhizobium yinganensis]|uniref:DUF4279 domain-containing protein n=1 Tax=Mesorhizobium yinganensis TaxID=3157707 RepID=UPI003CCD4911
MGEVSATQAGLRIGGTDLDPAEIAELLGCQPTRSHSKGDRISPTKQTLWKKGIWIVSSEWEPGDKLDSQIRKILSSLTSDAETWKALGHRFDVDMYCGVELMKPIWVCVSNFRQ